MVHNRAGLPARLAILAGALMLAAAASSCQNADDRPQRRLPTVRISFPDAGAEVLAEVARTDDEMTKGLMFRTKLADGEGMLFAYKTDERLTFWMKNTLIPLSIAYLTSDGTVEDIQDMLPRSLAPVPSSRSVRYALEVPQGWFSRAGVRPGQRASIPPLP